MASDLRAGNRWPVAGGWWLDDHTMAGHLSARMREEIGVVSSTQARGISTEIVSMTEHYGR